MSRIHAHGRAVSVLLFFFSYGKWSPETNNDGIKWILGVNFFSLWPWIQFNTCNMFNWPANTTNSFVCTGNPRNQVFVFQIQHAQQVRNPKLWKFTTHYSLGTTPEETIAVRTDERERQKKTELRVTTDEGELTPPDSTDTANLCGSLKTLLILFNRLI